MRGRAAGVRVKGSHWLSVVLTWPDSPLLIPDSRANAGQGRNNGRAMPTQLSILR